MLHSHCIYYKRLFPETPLVLAKDSDPTALPGGCVPAGGKGHGRFEGLSLLDLLPQNQWAAEGKRDKVTRQLNGRVRASKIKSKKKKSEKIQLTFRSQLT